MKHLVFLAALIIAFLILARYSIPWGVLLYDEADYVFAASRGLYTNATDHDSITTTEFLHQGLTRGRDKTQGQSLGAEIRGRNDVLLYRHWHGPAYYYLLDVALHLSPQDRSARYDTARWWCAVVPILTLLVIYFGCLWVTPGREGYYQAILASALFLLGPTTVTSLELAPHQMFVLFYVGSLIFSAKMLVTRDRRYFYGAAALAGLAFCTLEVTFVLIGMLLIVALAERGWIQLDWRFFGSAVGSFAVTVLVAWPAGLLKLSFIKAFLIMAYLAVYRRGAWGEVTLGQTWGARIFSSPLEWALILLAIVLFFARGQWRGRERFVYPFLLFAGLMILATLRVLTDIPRYSLTFLPALDLFAGCVIGFRARQAVQECGLRWRSVRFAAGCSRST